MKATYDFRIYADQTRRFGGLEALAARRSRVSPCVRAIGTVGDEQYRSLEQADRELARTGEHLIAGWEIRRAYSHSELERAKLLLLRLRYAHSAGEEFGTWYTDGELNPECAFERERITGSDLRPFKVVTTTNESVRCALSSRRVGPLRVPSSKLLKSRDAFLLWGGEVVVSGRFARLVEDGGFTGATLEPIWNIATKPKSKPVFDDVPSGAALLERATTLGLGQTDARFWIWIEEPQQLPLLDRALWEQKAAWEARQSKPETAHHYRNLVVHSKPVRVSAQSVFGGRPFRSDGDERCRCTHGEVRGNRLVSSMWVDGSSWDGSDLCVSDVFVGGRMGLFRPARLLMVSKRLFDAMRREKMKGFGVEVVEIIESEAASAV
jgi:hypothetical protein